MMRLNHMFEVYLIPLTMSSTKGVRIRSWFDRLTMSGWVTVRRILTGQL